MDLLFYIVPVFIGFVALMVFAGTILHFAAFGSIFWLAARKIQEQQALQSPRPCAWCGAELPPQATQCESCGAGRDTAKTR